MLAFQEGTAYGHPPTYGTPGPLRALLQSERAGEVKGVEWEGSRGQGEEHRGRSQDERGNVGNHQGLHRHLSDSLTHTCTLKHTHTRDCAVRPPTAALPRAQVLT